MTDKVAEGTKIAFALTLKERRECIEKIIKKNKKILYVFEQSLLPETKYNYKEYIKSVIIFSETSNNIMNGILTEVVINFYSILMNDFEKNKIKKIVHENTNLLVRLKEEIEVE